MKLIRVKMENYIILAEGQKQFNVMFYYINTFYIFYYSKKDGNTSTLKRVSKNWLRTSII